MFCKHFMFDTQIERQHDDVIRRKCAHETTESQNARQTIKERNKKTWTKLETTCECDVVQWNGGYLTIACNIMQIHQNACVCVLLVSLIWIFNCKVNNAIDMWIQVAERLRVTQQRNNISHENWKETETTTKKRKKVHRTIVVAKKSFAATTIWCKQYACAFDKLYVL